MFARTVKIIYRWPLVQTSELFTRARKQLNLIKKCESERKICHNGFRTAHGRPCIHDLTDIIENDGALLPEHFHGHWWIDRENAPAEARERILEPRVLPRQRAKARRKKQTGTGPNGTRREPLYSEHVDKNHPASPQQPSLPHMPNDPSTMSLGPPQAPSLRHDLRHTGSHPPVTQATVVQPTLPYSAPGPELLGLSSNSCMNGSDQLATNIHRQFIMSYHVHHTTQPPKPSHTRDSPLISTYITLASSKKRGRSFEPTSPLWDGVMCNIPRLIDRMRPMSYDFQVLVTSIGGIQCGGP